MTNSGRVTSEHTVGRTIAQALAARGISQSEFARRIGRAKSTVSAFLHGEKNPRIDTLARCAEVLETSVAELMAGRWRRVAKKAKAA